MRAKDIFEANESFKKVAIFPGRFQPPHKGHTQAWQWLKGQFGNAAIATSNKVEPPHSPFDFEEKKSLLMFAGIDMGSITETKNPYVAHEIVDSLDEDNTVVIFAVSEKDAERFSFKPKRDGSPSYFQSYKENMNDLEPRRKHGYIITLPTYKFTVLGNEVEGASAFRAAFRQANDSTQAKMIEDMYGRYSDQVHRLLHEKLGGD